MDKLTTTTNIDSSKLKEVFELNEGLTTRALENLNSKAKSLPIDLTLLTVAEGDSIESEINDLRKRGSDAIKMCKDRRMIFTRQFDLMKKAFTEQESSIETALIPYKSFADNWNTEKYKRQQSEQQESNKKIAEENAKIEYKQYVQEQRTAKCYALIEEYSKRMNDKFYSCTLGNIYAYKADLEGYIPKQLKGIDLLIELQKHPLLTEEQANEIQLATLNESTKELSQIYMSKLIAECNRIIELVPGRKEELVRIANDDSETKRVAERIAKEEEERKAQLEKDKSEAEAKAKDEANASKMDLAFENASISQETTLTKGTTVKMKYDVQNHKQMLSIIQYWVVNCMNLLTIDDLKKKLSFTITACNEALNKDGEIIEGVPTIENVRTRLSKK